MIHLCDDSLEPGRRSKKSEECPAAPSSVLKTALPSVGTRLNRRADVFVTYQVRMDNLTILNIF